MPKDTVSDDLRSPRIWRRAQASKQSALIKLDRLLVLGFDESRGAEAICTFASDKEAALAILKVFSFREQDASHFNDGIYEVFWDGGSFGVRRLSDGVRMGNQGFPSEGLAIDHLKSLYPKVA